MVYPAKSIANYFISKSITDPKVPLTPLKLIKLVYIAHGWCLALENKPLIQENVEAWQYGPVIPSLYQEFKRYGNSPITQLAEVEEEISPQDESVLGFLNKIWDGYGEWDGPQLSTWTHQEGSPWYFAWRNQPGKNTQIKDEMIKNYFENILATETSE